MSTHEPLKVSVVMPTYQRAAVLATTLPMLCQQTLPDIEILVSDDGSTDETPQVMQACRDSRVRYLRHSRLGMPGVLNAALQESRGEYVMFCHDHDFYEPTLLERLSSALDQHPSAVFAHCAIVVVDTAGAAERERYLDRFAPLTAGDEFLERVLLPQLDSKVTALTMVRRAALGDRLLDPRFEAVADVELWLWLCTQGDVAYVNEPLIRVRERDARSVLYGNALRWVQRVLEAKRLYLGQVVDPVRREAITASWRHDADRAAAQELLKALRRGDAASIAAVVEFAERECSSWGTLFVRSLSHAPMSLARGVLEATRMSHRAWRSLGMQRARPSTRARSVSSSPPLTAEAAIP